MPLSQSISSIASNVQSICSSSLEPWSPKISSTKSFITDNKRPLLYSLLGLYLTKKSYNFITEKGFFAKLRHGQLDQNTLAHQNGGDIVAKVLKANGVNRVFALSGGHVSPIFVGCENLGIEIVDVRHECNSVFAADATARITGKVGVAVVTAGPGVTNTITPLKNAQMAQSPVLLIGGAAPILQKGMGGLQDIDHIAIVKSICKFTKVITATRDIIPTMKKALSIATSGTPGPVFLEMPIDLLYDHKMISKEFGNSVPTKGFLAPFVAAYVFNHLHNLYVKMPKLDFNYNSTKILASSHLKIKNSDVKSAVKLLKKAQKPVVVFASQSTLAPENISKMVKFVSDYNIPAFTSGMARGLLGQKHKNLFRHCRRHALKNADVVLLLGVSVDFRVKYGLSFSRKSKIIMVNRSKEDGLKNSPFNWSPTIFAQCDPSEFLLKVAASWKDYGSFPTSVDPWVSELRALDNEKDGINRQKTKEFSPDHINPLKLLDCLNTILPEKSTLVTDGGDFIGSASYILQPRGPLTWLDPGAYGTLGVGGGFALASALNAKDLAIKGHETWLLWGDGSCGFSLTEVDTMVRNNLPVIILIGNDACWTQIAREQKVMFNSTAACMLEYTSYEKAAVGLGAAGGFVIDAKYDGQGKLVAESDDEQRGRITLVLKEAQRLARKEMKPVLVNCLIGGTNFRDGSISI